MKFFFTFLAVFIFTRIHSQNLVINPGFEEYSVCPSTVSDIHKAIGWGPARLDEGSTDYFNKCSKNHYSRVPLNHSGYQYPRTGNAYAGFFVYYKWTPDTFLREYIQSQLRQPLEANHKYLVSFYVNASDAVYYNGWLSHNTAIHSLGAYLSATPPYQDNYPYIGKDGNPKNYGSMPLIPQIVNTPGKFLSDTLSWMEVKGIYLAKGGEKYITIGNFNDDTHTDIQLIFPGTPSSYYYIDDVSVYCLEDECAVCDYTVNLGKDLSLCAGESTTLNAILEGATYVWQDGSKNATYSVTEPGIYWVDVFRNYCVIRDSIAVSFKQPTVNLGQDTTLCPGQTLILKSPSASPPYLWSNGTTNASLTVSKTGTYWLKAFQNGCAMTDTINVVFESIDRPRLLKDTAICSGQSLILTISAPGKTLRWSDYTTGSSIEVSEEGWYWVDVSDTRCISRDSIHVKLQECLFEIPNVFTPNGDQINDTFFIKGIHKDHWELTIANRWGKQVYINTNYKNEWNGNGLPMGVYYYRLTNQLSEKVYKGWVQILY